MLNYPLNSPTINTPCNRNGLLDMWNAFMLKGARFSPNDIPLCPTTAASPPPRLISYDEAKSIHRREMRKGNTDYHVDAFIHFFIDDQKFDGKRSSMSKPVTTNFSGTKGAGAALISRLEAKGEKFNKADVVAITQDPSDNIVWLEKGHLGDHPSGLAHIIDAHGSDFDKQGISRDEIPQYVMTAVMCWFFCPHLNIRVIFAQFVLLPNLLAT